MVDRSGGHLGCLRRGPARPAGSLGKTGATGTVEADRDPLHHTGAQCSGPGPDAAHLLQRTDRTEPDGASVWPGFMASESLRHCHRNAGIHLWSVLRGDLSRRVPGYSIWATGSRSCLRHESLASAAPHPVSVDDALCVAWPRQYLASPVERCRTDFAPGSQRHGAGSQTGR